MKRFLFLFNSILVFLSICSLVISYIPPTKLHFINYSSLLMPVFLILNALFAIYWLINLDKRVLLSSLFLVLSIGNLQKLYSFNFFEETTDNIDTATKKVISLMSYNSRHFSSADEHTVFIKDFIKVFHDDFPDILATQETFTSRILDLKAVYPYATNQNKSEKRVSNYILSKHPIINEGLVGLNDYSKGRDAAFADINLGNDTIRFYSVHLASYKFSKSAGDLQKRGGKSILKRFSQVFEFQEEQVNIIKAHISNSPYPVVILGDFNNNAFSYVYKELFKSSHLKDTFIEKGSGFGASYDFSYFPTRIDFIFVPETTQIHSHDIVRRKGWSDHFPIISKVSF